LPDVGEPACRLLGGGRKARLLRRERLEPLLERRESQRRPLLHVLRELFLEALLLPGQLLETRRLDVLGALARGELVAELLPAVPPLLHCPLGQRERLLRRALRRVRLLEPGAELAQDAIELLELHSVVLDVRPNLGDLLTRRAQVF